VRVRIASYNIHRAIGMDRRFRPQRIAEILGLLDADILMLQEVDEGVPRSRELDLARELAEELGYEHRAVGHNVTLRRGRYGNATLSRYPIQRESNIDLTIGWRKRRGCQHTRITVAGPTGRRHRVEVFNLHLGLSSRERAHQVGLLACAPEFAELPAGVVCLVGGDFNDWRSRLQPVFTRLLSFRPADEGGRGNGRLMATYPAFLPRGPLDRIYYRGPMRLLSAQRCRIPLARVASDHLPVVADFELR
jgi:endonuclease/exonuclease/phosphatase family metal-dependent hydrolase